MNKELIIDAQNEGVEIALLEDKKLVELHYEKGNEHFSVGDIYLGKIKKLMPGLNAVFLDVGHEKDAFLHYTDLSPYFNSLIKFTKECTELKDNQSKDFSRFPIQPLIAKDGKITDIFTGKPELLVQVLKEPFSNKGPRLSCEISFPGRFLVIVPFGNSVNISRKIHSSEERKRLQDIVEAIRPKNFSIIVRTAAEGQNTAEIHADILDLVSKWNTIKENLMGAKAPQKILGEFDKTQSILRDLLNNSFNKVVINDKKLMQDTKDYITRIMPQQAEIVALHENSQSIFDTYGITKQVKAAFGKVVNMASGSYLIIEHTEAMHVIDVNSGTRNAEADMEQNATATNLEAVQEIARQLRLRDLSGIITIDMIDMKSAENRKLIFDKMKEAMDKDKAKHTVLPLTKFGTMQITRQRLKPAISIITTENCPSCQGSGKISSSLLLADNIENDLKYLINQGHQNLKITVHPIVAAYLTKGLFWSSLKHQWKKKYKTKFEVAMDSNIGLTQYHFTDTQTDEIINLK